MNLFRILGKKPLTDAMRRPLRKTTDSDILPADLSHLLSIFILLQKMKTSSVRAAPNPPNRIPDGLADATLPHL